MATADIHVLDFFGKAKSRELENDLNLAFSEKWGPKETRTKSNKPEKVRFQFEDPLFGRFINCIIHGKSGSLTLHADRSFVYTDYSPELQAKIQMMSDRYPEYFSTSPSDSHNQQTMIIEIKHFWRPWMTNELR